MSIDWKDNYKIGNDEIDRQHQHLFELANKLVTESDHAKVTGLAMQLYKHTREHFEMEEALMHQVGFADCTAHTAYHNKLLGRLNEISHGMGKGTLDRPELEALMTDWTLRHVVIDDAILAENISNRERQIP